ncbi:hypothetical protein VYU27_006276 [Nannochloropsis oceanica]
MEDPEEASALLAQAAIFPPGSLQRRFTLHYWRHAGLDAQKEYQTREETHIGEQEGHNLLYGLHQYLYHHPNGLFIVGLAKDNVILKMCRQESITIASVEFLPDNKPSGKGKRGAGGGDVGAGPEATSAGASPAGATSTVIKRVRITSRGRGKKQKGSLHVRRDTVLARVVLSDGREFPVFGGVNGQVLELNELLSEDPGLLLRQPEDQGYIAILQPPRFAAIPPDLSHLIAPEAYRDAREAEGQGKDGAGGNKDGHAPTGPSS